jgi:uncharacterized NAD(P)/FAD-binding protein YdhS
MKSSVAFVGAGPTTIYTLHALVDLATQPFDLTIFEEQSSVGRGTPYRPGWNDPAMLSNIASIEIPPIEETLVDWLTRQSDERLGKLGITPGEIDERTFYPRVALGDFFHDQMEALIARAKSQGIDITIRTGCRVVDAISGGDAMTLVVRPRRGETYEQEFDHVVLATGHQWPAQPEVRPGYFISPWPASALDTVPACRVGIRGSSLSAIDAAVALAVRHGEFIEVGKRLAYVPDEDADGFSLTMMSRKGLLPEADFYFPFPYAPLAICTAEAIETLVASREGDYLDEAFALFKVELAAADPDYAQSIGLDELGIEGFAERYFARRVATDPFVWAEANLCEAEENYRACRTVAWRYAILRMHEVMELLVPHLDDEDFVRFSTSLGPVFVDDYATVPHESIKRLLALHAARKLEVMALGSDYHIDSRQSADGAILILGADRLHFPAFIEATGQRALSAKDFPFPSLRKQGIVRDVADSDGPARGIVIDDEFHLVSNDIAADQLFCLSLPFLMGRHPFVQGITSAHQMGLTVGEQLAAAIDAKAMRAVRKVAVG